MAWTTIADYTNGQVLTATNLNNLMDNILHLFSPPQDRKSATGAITSTSTSFVSVSASLELSLSNFSGGLLLVALVGPMRYSDGGAGRHGFLDFEVNGARLGDTTDGLARLGRSDNAAGAMYFGTVFLRVVTGVSPGSVTIKPMWKSGNAADTLQLGNAGEIVYSFAREL